MYDAVVIGVSAGGMEALRTILPVLPASFPAPVVIVQHVADTSEFYLVEYLNHYAAVHVKEAEDKESLKPGVVYLAPPGYHLLIEPDHSLSLSADSRVNFSCPSIDVLFESAADAYEEKLIGVVLTGGNKDGSAGLSRIKARGGLAIVQNPSTAYVSCMPEAAMEAVQPDYVADLEHIGALITGLVLPSERKNHGTGTRR